MSDMLSYIGMLVALLVAVTGWSSIRRGFHVAVLPTLCAFAYILLESDWVRTSQAIAIGDLSNVAWSMVKIGFMVGFLACARARDMERREFCERLKRMAGRKRLYVGLPDGSSLPGRCDSSGLGVQGVLRSWPQCGYDLRSQGQDEQDPGAGGTDQAAGGRTIGGEEADR